MRREDQRAEHVRAMLHVQEDLGYLAKDVSEIDAGDPDNIRIVAKAGNRAVELTMGDANFAKRYQNFLAHFAEIEKHSPGVKVVRSAHGRSHHGQGSKPKQGIRH